MTWVALVMLGIILAGVTWILRDEPTMHGPWPGNVAAAAGRESLGGRTKTGGGVAMAEHSSDQIKQAQLELEREKLELERQKLAVAFHMEEYKSLRDEIKQKLGERLVIQRQAVIAIGLIYAAISTIDTSRILPEVRGYFWLVWWVPPVIAFLSRLAAAINGEMVSLAGSYIRSGIEGKWFGTGWESFFRGHNSKAKKLFTAETWAWYALIALTILLAVVATFYTHSDPIGTPPAGLAKP